MKENTAHSRTVRPTCILKVRDNILLYSLTLPLASYPALQLFTLFGDFFGFSSIYLGRARCSFVPCCKAVCHGEHAPERHPGSAIGTGAAITGLFLIYFANLMCLHPGAMVRPEWRLLAGRGRCLHYNLLFAGYAAVSYLTFREIFRSRDSRGTPWTLQQKSAVLYILWGGAARITCSSHSSSHSAYSLSSAHPRLREESGKTYISGW